MILKNAKWVFLAIALIAVLANISTCNQKNTWQDKYKTYYDSTRIVLARSDSLIKVARTAMAVADSAKLAGAHQTQVINATETNLANMTDSTARMQHKLDSLVAANGQTNPQACQQCFLVNKQLHTELDTAHALIVRLDERDLTRLTEIGSLRTAVHNDTLSIIDLRRQLADMPKPQSPPKLFWVLNVNPNQAFLAGSVITILAVITLGGKL